ncbi:hypothetical protein [Sulfuriroseicoccus oceanibius]|uniref:Uncharacterized protein n=1 Tax=Sulfuriroseicoccus oceanibius TaxID=2707525 RepID=A0A6B3L227_9BACT|nr:hypothetical protein [Sulfuriroseicoccus oceanibius]QQL45578.1 hypothetical protein G3M56_003035 [Sulfuriroseicoccus oceanibius]
MKWIADELAGGAECLGWVVPPLAMIGARSLNYELDLIMKAHLIFIFSLLMAVFSCLCCSAYAEEPKGGVEVLRSENLEKLLVEVVSREGRLVDIEPAETKHLCRPFAFTKGHFPADVVRDEISYYLTFFSEVGLTSVDLPLLVQKLSPRFEAGVLTDSEALLLLRVCRLTVDEVSKQLEE